MRHAYEFAKTSDAHAIVIAAQWNGHFNDNRIFIGNDPLGSEEGRRKVFAVLQSELESLNKLGKKVYLVFNIPIGPQFSPKSWMKRTLRGIEVQPIHEVERSSMPMEYETIARDLTRVAAATGTTVIDPFSYFCDTRACRSVDENGNPIYKDGNHLRASFVRAHVDYLDGLLLNETKAASASALVQ